MPCSIAGHVHEWPPSDSAAPPANFYICSCERVCGFCPAEERTQSPTVDILRKHVLYVHLFGTGDCAQHTLLSHTELISASEAVREAVYNRPWSNWADDLDQPLRPDALDNHTTSPEARLQESLQRLFIKPSQGLVFAQLAVKHLDGPTASPDDELRSQAARFLRLYGAQLWPIDGDQRDHLIRSDDPNSSESILHKQLWHNVAKDPRLQGPVYGYDNIMTKPARLLWRQSHYKKRPNRDEQLMGSKMCKAIQEYFEILLAHKDNWRLANDEISENELLLLIIGKVPSDSSKTARAAKKFKQPAFETSLKSPLPVRKPAELSITSLQQGKKSPPKRVFNPLDSPEKHLLTTPLAAEPQHKKLRVDEPSAGNVPWIDALCAVIDDVHSANLARTRKDSAVDAMNPKLLSEGPVSHAADFSLEERKAQAALLTQMLRHAETFDGPPTRKPR